MRQVIKDLSGQEHVVDVIRVENLVCKADGANKFWSGILGRLEKDVTRRVQPYVVVLRWGRIGTVGSGPEIKKFNSESSAISYFEGRLKDKWNKGYVSSNEPIPPKVPNTPQVTNAISYQPSAYEWDLF